MTALRIGKSGIHTKGVLQNKKATRRNRRKGCKKRAAGGRVKGGKARPSRSIKKISGKLPEILQGAVAKCILQRPHFVYPNLAPGPNAAPVGAHAHMRPYPQGPNTAPVGANAHIGPLSPRPNAAPARRGGDCIGVRSTRISIILNIEIVSRHRFLRFSHV